MAGRLTNVRFNAEDGRKAKPAAFLLGAISGRPRLGKHNAGIAIDRCRLHSELDAK
jgi:hypothetical protein